MTTASALQSILAAPVPGTTHVGPTTAEIAFTALIWLGVAILLGWFGEWLAMKTKFGLIVKGLSLLSFVGFLAILNNKVLGGGIDSAGATVTGVATREAVSHGLSANVAGIALAIAIVMAVSYIFLRGPFAIVTGLVFGMAVLVATRGNDFVWLNQALQGWYDFVTPNTP